MAEQTVLVAIDIGTTKVCVLIGEMAARGGVDVIGIGLAASDGLRKGVVIDIDRTVQSVASAVEAAERISGLKVRSAFVGISGSHISSQNSRGMVAVSGSSRHDVDRGDTVRAIEAARAVSIPNTREILHVVPRGYVVDGQEGVRDPIGMTAVRLEVETHIVTASTTSVQNLTKCVQRAGVEIDELVLAPMATAEATLNDEDRELGVCLADIGGDTTDVAIFQDGSISHCATIPMGGRSVTAGLVLTGGGSLLNGVQRAARDQLGMSARIAGPTGLGGLTDQIATPPYSAASGLLLWGARNWGTDDDRDGHGPRAPFDGVTSRI